MTLDPQIVVPWAIGLMFAVVGIAAMVTLLALDRARRAEDRATLYQALLDQHGISYPEENP